MSEKNTSTQAKAKEPSLWRTELALLIAIVLIAIAVHHGIEGLY